MAPILTEPYTTLQRVRVWTRGNILLNQYKKRSDVGKVAATSVDMEFERKVMLFYTLGFF